jgi:hypothetical protein
VEVTPFAVEEHVDVVGRAFAIGCHGCCSLMWMVELWVTNLNFDSHLN